MRSEFVDTPSGRLHLRVRDGQGMPLLLWPSIFYDHTLYLPLVERCANPAVIVDGPGHGRSTVDPSGLGLPALAATAAQLAHHTFGKMPFVMVGTSWGSQVALALAEAHDPLLAGAVLFNPPWTGRERPSLGDRAIMAMSAAMPRTALFRNGVARSFFAPSTQRDNPRLVADFVDQQGFANPGLSTAVRSVLTGNRAGPSDAARAVDIPMLVVAGAEDRLYTPKTLQEQARRIGRSEFAIVNDSAHITAAEQPDRAAALLAAFIERIDDNRSHSNAA